METGLVTPEDEYLLRCQCGDVLFWSIPAIVWLSACPDPVDFGQQDISRRCGISEKEYGDSICVVLELRVFGPVHMKVLNHLVTMVLDKSPDFLVTVVAGIRLLCVRAGVRSGTGWVWAFKT
jgi:hypothetical protein